MSRVGPEGGHLRSIWDSVSKFASGLTLARDSLLSYRISFASLLLVLLTPLIVDSRLYFPFVSSKVLFLRTLVQVSLLFYVLLAFRVPRFRIRFHFILVSTGIFLGVQVLAGVRGFNLVRSFWGDLERGEGLLTQVHLVIFFVLMATLIRTLEDRKLVVCVWLIVAVIVAGIAFLQFLSADLPVRPGSTLGNPAFLAAYMLLTLFLAFWMHASTQTLWIRRGLWFLEGWIFAAMILTGTRSAILGAAVGGGLTLAGLWRSVARRSHCKLAAIVLVTLVLAVGSILIWQDSPLPHSVLLPHRLASTSLDSQSARVRVLIWKSVLEAVKQRPLLGYGPENLGVGFNRNFPAELFSLSPQKTWVDRSHNILLDIALASGLIGVATFLLLSGSILFTLRRSWLKRNRPATLIMGGAFVASFVEAQFSVPTLSSQLGFWTLAAIVVHLDHQGEGSDRSSFARIPVRRVKTAVLAAVGFVLLLAAVWTFNMAEERACQHLASGTEAAKKGQRDWAIRHFQQAIEQNSSYTLDARKVLAETILDWYNRIPGGPALVSAHVDYAIRELEAAVAVAPEDVKSQLLLAKLCNRSAGYNIDRADMALTTARTALLLAPTRPEVYFELGQAHMFKRDFEKALAAFHSAVELAPGSIESRWNLAVSLELAGRDQESEAEFQKLQDQGTDLSSPLYLRRLVAAYQVTGKAGKLRNVLEKLVLLEPENPAWQQLLNEMSLAETQSRSTTE